MAVFSRVKSAWNAFVSKNDPEPEYMDAGPSYGVKPDRPRLRYHNERTIISSIYTRVGIDVSGMILKHVQLDENGRYLKDVDSSLNEALTFEPNLDQGPRAFRQDIPTTLFDKGVLAIVPVDTTIDPNTNEIFDIHTLRVGEIITWYPKHIRVSVYNEAKGRREEVTLEKRFVAIVENPLYGVMNEPNSTYQRLIRKLSLLDVTDEQASSGKLDLIIQLPYVIKSEARKEAAEKRREDIEFQLRGTGPGIAYTDGTEKVIQLNRAVENNLLPQIEFLTKLLYEQLGITAEVMAGTADEAQMINYYNRTIEPILDAVVEAMQRSFLGPSALVKKQRIHYFKDPFKLVPVSQIAEIADVFTRNEILTSNEIRGFLGIAPRSEPQADALVNPNMPQPGAVATDPAAVDATAEDQAAQDQVVQDAFDAIDTELDAVFKDLGAEG